MYVAVLGASPKAERYSNMAVARLMEQGHTVYPVHPAIQEIHGLKVYPSLAKVPRPVDTLTLYVNPKLLREALSDVKELKPKRVIFNPGTEDQEIIKQLNQEGIETLQACTLVLLSTGKF